MNKTLRTFVVLPRWGFGTALLALCACDPASRADVIVNNTANSVGGHTTANQGLVQDFTPTVGGMLSSVTLSLYSTTGGSVEVYIYSGTPSGTSPGTPSISGVDLGSLSVGTSGVQLLTLLGLGSKGYSLANGTVYGIQIAGTTSIGWDYTSSGATASGSGGSITGYAWGNGGSGGNYTQGVGYTELAVNTISLVPEVPLTGWVMGFGALAIAARHALSRKIEAGSPAKARPRV